MNHSPRLVQYTKIALYVTSGFFLGWLLHPEKTIPQPPRPIFTQPAQTDPPPTATAAISASPQPFHWSQVESPDYLTYVANLRSIGCPELTVRDIIVADVNQLFAPRYAALASKAPTLAWWSQQDKRQTVNVIVENQILALNEEKHRLIERLLGLSASSFPTFQDLNASSVRESLTWDYLPATKRAALKHVLARYTALKEWGQTHWKNLPSDEREAREREIFQTRLTELSKLLTPAELAEFQLRDSPTANALRELVGKADLTEVEFRKLYGLRAQFEEQNPEPQREDWNRLDEQASNALGSDRYAEIQRQNDPLWRAMQDLAGQDGNPSLNHETMQQAYQVQQEYTKKMVQAVGALFADPQQDPAPLRKLAAEMESKLSNILGAEAVERLDRNKALPRLVIQDDGKSKRYSLSPGAFSE